MWPFRRTHLLTQIGIYIQNRTRIVKTLFILNFILFLYCGMNALFLKIWGNYYWISGCYYWHCCYLREWLYVYCNCVVNILIYTFVHQYISKNLVFHRNYKYCRYKETYELKNSSFAISTFGGLHRYVCKVVTLHLFIFRSRLSIAWECTEMLHTIWI